MGTEKLAKKQPRSRSTQHVTRLPRGTTRNPWYLVPEYYDTDGKLIKAHYEYVSPLGVWKMTQLPSTCCVKLDTSY